MDEISWASNLYTAHTIGMSEAEFWKMDPFLFYEMVDMHVKYERSKYGK